MSINQPTILIADDDKRVHALLRKMLEPEYRILSVFNGIEALERIDTLEENQLDLILLDVIMPEMGGYEMFEQFQKRFRGRNIPTIFLTAKVEECYEKKGLGLGAIDYISKPFDSDILLLRVRNHVLQKHLQDRLHQMSMVDVLTNLYNRRQFDLRVEEEWSRCMRHQSELALLMIDVDYFKCFNDTYGHPEGDECLAKIAHTIQDCFRRASDFVARYGGEEFVVLLPDTSLKNGVRLANELLQRVVQLDITHQTSDAADHITVSIGVASVVPESSASLHALIDEADRNLYQAKNGGRNCVVSAEV